MLHHRSGADSTDAIWLRYLRALEYEAFVELMLEYVRAPGQQCEV